MIGPRISGLSREGIPRALLTQTGFICNCIFFNDISPFILTALIEITSGDSF